MCDTDLVRGMCDTDFVRGSSTTQTLLEAVGSKHTQAVRHKQERDKRAVHTHALEPVTRQARVPQVGTMPTSGTPD